MFCDGSVLFTLITAAVTAFSMLGGVMASFSGARASAALWNGRTPAELADTINRGFAIGFGVGLPFATLAFIIVFAG